MPHALGGRRLAPSLVAPSWLGLARPALTLAAGWPRCVVVGLSHSAATPAMPALEKLYLHNIPASAAAKVAVYAARANLRSNW